MSTVRSMTGFAQVRRETTSGELTVSLRSVNHRGFDPHFYHSSLFAAYESAIREILKQNITRGHVEVRTDLYRRNESSLVAFHSGVLEQYAQAFRQAAATLGLSIEPDLNTLVTLPGVIGRVENDSSLHAGFEQDLLAALTDCADELNRCREREGSALALHITGELTALAEKVHQIGVIRSHAAPLLLARLKERLDQLLAGTPVSEARLIEEAALLADRSDIQEEVIRLSVHTTELARIVAAGGEVGKKIDFLLQEMNREANTVLSKTAGVGEVGLTITALGLGIKAHTEKMREQALNLE